MRLDQLLNNRTSKKDIPNSLKEIYNNSELQAEWDSLYPSEDETDELMEEYRQDLKERNLLTNYTN